MLDERLDVAGDLLVEERLPDAVDDQPRGLRADVGEVEPLLQFVEELLIDLPLPAEQVEDPREDALRLRQPRLDLAGQPPEHAESSEVSRAVSTIVRTRTRPVLVERSPRTQRGLILEYTPPQLPGACVHDARMRWSAGSVRGPTRRAVRAACSPSPVAASNAGRGAGRLLQGREGRSPQDRDRQEGDRYRSAASRAKYVKAALKEGDKSLQRRRHPRQGGGRQLSRHRRQAGPHAQHGQVRRTTNSFTAWTSSTSRTRCRTPATSRS